MIKISVIGLGYVGLPVSCVFAQAGYNVLGVDVSEHVVKTLGSGKVHIKEDGLQSLFENAVETGNLKISSNVQPSDIFVICVPTPFNDDFAPDLSYVYKALDSLIPVVESNNLIIIESTIPVGTTNKLESHAVDLLKSNNKLFNQLLFAHCPERVLPGNSINEIINNDRIVGGTTHEATLKAAEIYQSFSHGKVAMTTAVNAEFAKLAENTYRDVNIAFANELSMLCGEFNADMREIIDLANMHPRVNIHQPGPGVGGHCIPVDPWFIINGFKGNTDLIQAARQVNQKKEDWVLSIVSNELLNRSFKNIYILGMSYKPNVDDFRESPSVRIAIKASKAFDIPIYCVDPEISKISGCLDTTCRFLDAVVIEPDSLYLLLVNHSCFISSLDLIDKDTSSLLLKFA